MKLVEFRQNYIYIYIFPTIQKLFTQRQFKTITISVEQADNFNKLSKYFNKKA